MKHFVKKLSALAASSAMVLGTGLTSVYAFDADAVTEIPEPEWEVSKSKTATPLDISYESEVTLSLPSAEEQLDTDVVFVLDKSKSNEVEKQALQMLKNLQEQVQLTNAKVNVGTVIFNSKANVTDFMDLETEYTKIEEAIQDEYTSGTNTHAGLLAGKEMLDKDTDVDASHKYLIFVSDGITYMYDKNPTVLAWDWYTDNYQQTNNMFAGPDNWGTKHGTPDSGVQDVAPENWDQYLDEVEKELYGENNDIQYAYPYKGTVTDKSPYLEYESHANSVDAALYFTRQVYYEAQTAGYHCYAMTATQKSDGMKYVWGPSFMNYLAGGEEVSFDTIQNDIVYAIDSSSVVIDEIGAGTDSQGNPYEFEFIEGSLKLTVGGKEYEAVKLDDGSCGFKANGNMGYEYIVKYEAPEKNDPTDGDAGRLTWYINVPVTNLERVQLSYRVRLVNPQSTAGEYTGLSTNKSAVIYPVDSQGNSRGKDAFENPEVSYTLIKADVSKVWEDEDNAYETRPESIRVNLYADGEEVLSDILSDRNEWSTEFDGLRMYSDYEGGTLIDYTVKENEEVSGYSAEITGDTENGFVITNTLKIRPETPVTPDEPETPQKEVPDTSDSSNILGLAGMTMMALGAACLVIVMKKRHA